MKKPLIVGLTAATGSEVRWTSSRRPRPGLAGIVAVAGAAFVLSALPVMAQGAMPMPEGTGPLEAGTYVDRSLGVELTLTVPDGWEIANESVDGVGVDLTTTGFIPAGPEGVAFLGFTRFDGEVFDGDCQPANMEEPEYLDQHVAIDDSVQGLVDRLVADPFLTTSEPEPVQIGGHSGLRIDASASVPDDCATPVTHLWAIPVFGSWNLADGMSAQYNVLDVDGNVVVIVLERSADVDFETFAADASEVLDSVMLTTDADGPG
jgi:hypothetical protein